ncbi:metallophosphoesterase [Catalinimonas sp. 4WD22]|uniref:metallophosphoesterase n=1 Tax=Catalinimonas locisalis TaxID=3133978 RepID=UPI003100ECAF
MRILHLTDFHYGKKYKSKVDRMFPSLLKKLGEISKEKKIDYVVFSGDLVYSGKEIEDFKEVQNLFLYEICRTLNIDERDILICAGNHDMEAGKEITAIKEYVDKINNNETLDDFVEDNIQFNLSYANSKNYHQFVNAYYNNDSDVVSELYHVFKRTHQTEKIGFVSFNTSWRSFIGNHSGHLLIPSRVVNKAIDELRDCGFKIVIIHHPLEDLKSFNKYLIEDTILENFHLCFSGHYHKRKQSIDITHDYGMLSLSSAATMSGDDGSTIGFSVVEIETDTFDVNIQNFTYAKSDNIFTNTSNKKISIPVEEEKSEQIKILKETRRYYNECLFEANNLLIHDESESNDFNDLFTDPVMYDKSATEYIKKKNEANKVELLQLIQSNTVLYGKDKSGKSTLLHKIRLELLRNFKDYKVIPIYLQLHQFSNQTSFNLIEVFRKMFDVNTSKAASLIMRSKIQFIIDDFNPDNSFHIKLLDQLKEQGAVNYFLLSSDETQASYFDNFKIKEEPISKAYIHPISRSTIRTQTNKLLVKYSDEEKESIIKRIIDIFSQLSIPFNFWSLSLFLWIYWKRRIS